MYFKDSQIYIRIKEIKNGFRDGKPGDYQDLKVIFESYLAESDIAFQMECQCNLETIIKWNTSEHILYDYVRAEDDYLTVITKLLATSVLLGYKKSTPNVVKRQVLNQET
eukprot:Mrub_06643.p2 GENE.Mrub_06643~~Mrub_06643.p2  ORF type:complete len:110 (-),score=11.53 Mrub_06643:135-464(-)